MIVVKDDYELVLELARVLFDLNKLRECWTARLHRAAPSSGGFDLDESPQALDQWNNMAGISVPWCASQPPFFSC